MDNINMTGTVYVIGLGPGRRDLVTPAALAAIERCPVIAGYTKYVAQINDLLADKKVIKNGMGGEVERCRLALEEALQGQDVCVVCSGDPGIFAMGGLIYELRDLEKRFVDIAIEVVPGLTAVNAAAARLGSPLTNGCAIISLSDLLTPTATIIRNLEAISRSDMACALYNPAGKKRRELLNRAVEIFRQHRGAEIPAAVVKHASRKDEEKWLGRLGDLPLEMVDMNSLIVIGNSTSVINKGIFYDRRGYAEKYFKQN
ncbi:MAG: precorrin-3B C(17)-methyltransferase [Pseudomonadota bacterium]|nr:precorrin-3B C(17)-methyltransferase [Pseudomonadota bacterium]